MSVNDEAAREKRARELHALIDEITTPKPETPKAKDDDPDTGPVNYRERIHKKMHDLDKDQHA
jgi:hypothetical protein